jgi:hypothetical protein
MGCNHIRAAAAATSLALAAAVPTAADETKPMLHVHVRDTAQISQRTLKEALEIAGGIYRRSGVVVEWLPEPNDIDPGDDLSIVIVAGALRSPFPVVEDSMGVVRVADGVRARVAYVFRDRVYGFAEQSHVDFWIVLGCAVAHELGHLVLPVNAHAPDGIMRARWDPGMIARAGGFLNFTAEQGRVLRMRLATRER